MKWPIKVFKLNEMANQMWFKPFYKISNLFNKNKVSDNSVLSMRYKNSANDILKSFSYFFFQENRL